MKLLKKLYNEIKDGSIISNATDVLKSTEKFLLNKGGINVLLMAIPFICLSAVLTMIGGMISLKFNELVQIVVSTVINTLIFIFLTMGTSVACFDSFNSLVNEGRKPDFNTFFNSLKTKAIPFTIKYVRYVSIYIFIATVLLVGVRFIPIIGKLTSTIITTILTYGLMFKMYAMMLDKDAKSEVWDKSTHWFAFALIACICNVFVKFTLIRTFMKYLFILFAVVSLSDKYSSSSEDMFNDFNDGFEDVVKLNNNNNTKYKENNFDDDDFEDMYKF